MRNLIVVILAVLVSVMNCQTDEPNECIANFLLNNLDVTLAAVRDCETPIVSKIWRKCMLHELAN